MLRALSVGLCFLALLGPSAHADELDDFTTGMAELLAGESYCGLAYDQEALAALIARKVPADDMGWTQTLAGNRFLSGERLKRFTPSEKTVHCTQLNRLAHAFGLLD